MKMKSFPFWYRFTLALPSLDKRIRQFPTYLLCSHVPRESLPEFFRDGMEGDGEGGGGWRRGVVNGMGW